MPKQDGAQISAAANIDSDIRGTEQSVRLAREKAHKFIEAMDRFLDELDRIKVTKNLPSEARHTESGPFRYLRMPMIEAIESFLEKASGPQTREQIIAEMKDGGAVLAQVRPEVEVNKSIDYWLLTEAEKKKKYRKRKIKIVSPKLKRFGDKIGRIGWRPSKG
ncbi:MAG TPA: hypothetical protein VIX19_20705 [Terriglobales bacterium]